MNTLKSMLPSLVAGMLSRARDRAAAFARGSKGRLTNAALAQMGMVARSRFQPYAPRPSQKKRRLIERRRGW